MPSNVWDEIIYTFPYFNGWSFGVGKYHTWLGMWLLIYAGIKLNPG